MCKRYANDDDKDGIRLDRYEKSSVEEEENGDKKRCLFVGKLLYREYGWLSELKELIKSGKKKDKSIIYWGLYITNVVSLVSRRLWQLVPRALESGGWIAAVEGTWKGAIVAVEGKRGIYIRKARPKRCGHNDVGGNFSVSGSNNVSGCRLCGVRPGTRRSAQLGPPMMQGPPVPPSSGHILAF
ncbi:hypothetical protein PV327_007753 [Microctonus hyperodae]|uniref:Uncharacterized protein n=1 Tax=Microctonus hyperodae TaxID=165561 RepID=A0AA39KYT6_MICHY|nr:hypothetical protein PV327_007753 [Microctonus hyperodae]